MMHFIKTLLSLVVLAFLGVIGVWISESCSLQTFSCTHENGDKRSADTVVSSVLQKVNK